MSDLNVHNRPWLRFTNRDSVEGNELEAVWSYNGFLQLVTKPTRGPHLLDLALTDLLAECVAKLFTEFMPTTTTESSRLRT